MPSSKRAGRPTFTARYLNEWGNDVTVVCPRPDPSDADESNAQLGGVNFKYLEEGFKQFSPLSRIRLMRSMERTVRSEVRSNKYDVIRTQSVIPSYAAVKGAGGKVPVYGELADFLSDLYVEFEMPARRVALPIIRRIERRVAKEISYASAETPVGRNDWSALGLDRRKIAVIPSGVDTEHFHPDNRERSSLRSRFGAESGKILVYHGDISKLDGVEYLINSTELLDEEVRVIVIGDGPRLLMEELKRMVQKANLQNRVTFTGWIDYSVLPAYLSMADAGVAPFVPLTRKSRSNFHTKIREYLAMHMMVVATETEGLKSIIDDIPVYVRDPTDARDLASKINEALESGAITRRIPIIDKVISRIDWHEVVKRDEKFMTDISNGAVGDAGDFDLMVAEDNREGHARLNSSG